jgi:O-antigen ligase/polysaccharide polymerase Wzy-like membrane protein
MRHSLEPQPLPLAARPLVAGGAASRRNNGFFAAGARLRTAVFLLGVIAINYTWSRPSPVDGIFLIALLLTLLSEQRVNIRNLILFFLVGTWLFSVFVSSVSLIDNPLVIFQFIALTSVILIGITSSLVTAGWGRADLERFIKVYVFANVIAAIVGVYGFVSQNPALTWAGRPTGFLDDPDMFGVFLIPGIIGSLYMIAKKRSRYWYAFALALLSIAVLMSFSRAAIVSALLFGGASFFYFNRRNLAKASLAAVAVVLVVSVPCLFLYLTNDTFAEMLTGRFKIAEEYDLGYFGRYNRYLLSIPLILDHPLGLGLFEIDKIFPEPIHNIWISSFLNYGWLAGFAWTLLMVLSVQQAWYNWKRSGDELFLLILFCWLSVVSCAMLHQAERWRFLWLFTGMLWGLNYRNFIPASREAPASEEQPVYREAA